MLRLKTSIFLWVTLATLLPLVLLVFAVTAYSEKRYQEDVADRVSKNLDNIVSEIDRRIYYDLKVIISLASSRNMKEYHRVLESLNKGKMHAQHYQRSERVSEFLASFRAVVPGLKTIRLLSQHNKTLVKITSKQTLIGELAGIESSPFVDEDTGDESVQKLLEELPKNEVSFLLLPESRWDWEDPRGPPMLSVVVPLEPKKERLGYLVIGFSGEGIDRIFELATKAHNGSLLVAELNPEDKERNGMLLYEDLQGVRFAKSESPPIFLRVVDGGRLWGYVHSEPEGNFVSAGGHYRTFYKEYEPYKNRLVSWVVAIRINLEEVSAPFRRIRAGIIVLTAIALLVCLFLARMGAINIARPVIMMSKSLKEYADGNKKARVQVKGADEIRMLESSFNYMADNLEKAQKMMLQNAKLASIGQMAAGIGHEINNPLNNILSLIKLILRSLPENNERLANDIKSLREEGQRASEIIKGVLNFARQVPPQYVEFEIKDWVEETVRLVSQVSKERLVSLEITIASEITISGDRNQLQQVLVNLLINGIQASEQYSTVTIKVEKRQEDIVIWVIDQGVGIKPEVLDQIYDPFFSTKAEGEGTGLGLSISLGIIEHHSGSLVLENNAGRGVTACIHLPSGPD